MNKILGSTRKFWNATAVALLLVTLVTAGGPLAIRQAFRKLQPPFSGSILEIFAGGSQKKMLWTDATWIVAFMADVQAHWNITEPHDPCKAMGPSGFTAPANAAVTSWIFATYPYPTSCGLFNFSPKSFCQSPAFGSLYMPIRAFSAAIFSRTLPKRMEYALAI